MGVDGGAIPKRCEMVIAGSSKPKKEQRDAERDRLYKWAHCALSQQALARRGVLACEMGKLYSKEAVLQLLLGEGGDRPPWAHHVARMKDVVELKLEANPAYREGGMVGEGVYEDTQVSRFMCPVTGLEMNGRFKFLFNFETGLVVSERGLKMVEGEEGEEERYREEDMVVINPAEEELDLMDRRMVARRARKKKEKKAKKLVDASEKTKEMILFKTPAVPLVSRVEDESIIPNSTNKEGPPLKKAKVVDSATKDKGKGKKSKKEVNKNASKGGEQKSTFNPFAELARKEKEEGLRTVRGDRSEVGLPEHRVDLAYQGTSIQEQGARGARGEARTEVYKRIFTTHQSAQNLPRNAWTTYDPRYN